MKKIAIMQPYFMPYLGYFQLLNAVDAFVIYDNIQFTKRGWIHRNRVLENGKDTFITLPLKKASDYLDIKEREITEDFNQKKNKLISKIENNYKKAPYAQVTLQLVREIFDHRSSNLFDFVFNSVVLLKNHLDINTEMMISSELQIDHDLRSAHKVKAFVEYLEGDIYINPVGGKELYHKEDFKLNGIDLFFLKTRDYNYKQFQNEFIPFLSIIDTLMFNSIDTVKLWLNNYDLE